MKKYPILILAVIAAAAIVYVATRIGTPQRGAVPGPENNASKAATTTDGAIYTCPMHPSVRKNSPGTCPVCGMTLVKKQDEDAAGDHADAGATEMTISPGRQILANVATTVAERRALRKEIHAVGRIAYAEPGLKKISMRFPGRIEKLYVTYIGQQVRVGDPVADVYSPEAISAQQEYLLAQDSYEEVKDETELVSEGARSLFDQAHEKLVRMGFSDAQISELGNAHEARKILTIYSHVTGKVLRKSVEPQHYASTGEDIFDIADVSGVWLYADVYENEIRFIAQGQTVTAVSEAIPGKIFRGNVAFISPTIDPESRTVRVRADFPNPKDELKIDMYLKTTILVSIPPSVVLPPTAILSSGRREIVWRQKSERVFEQRVVKTGVRTEEGVQIMEGIEAGDVVVTSGGYLLDSESRLQSGDGQPEVPHD